MVALCIMGQDLILTCALSASLNSSDTVLHSPSCVGEQLAFIWVYIVDSYSVDIEVLEDDPVPWSYAICPVFTGLVGSIVQIFLARRIWTLSNMSRKGCIIALVIILLASTEAILCFIITSNVNNFCLQLAKLYLHH
ncbi:hypothetical protein AX16_003347 [Volvariella volvacea WC 439]|nr:hypothetical protein AX16_003347 [Volvariella volvacea WC 439]